MLAARDAARIVIDIGKIDRRGRTRSDRDLQIAQRLDHHCAARAHLTARDVAPCHRVERTEVADRRGYRDVSTRRQR